MKTRTTLPARLALLAALCVAPLATGCRTAPAMAEDGSAARLVAAVRQAEARADHGLPTDHPLSRAHQLLAAAE